MWQNYYCPIVTYHFIELEQRSGRDSCESVKYVQWRKQSKVPAHSPCNPSTLKNNENQVSFECTTYKLPWRTEMM